MDKNCKSCQGTGKVNALYFGEMECPECNGTGEIKDEKDQNK